MKTINEKQLKELLYSSTEEHQDFIINVESLYTLDLKHVTSFNRFTNCKFKGDRLDFKNSEFNEESETSHSFHFDNCEFFNEIFFLDCKIAELKFFNIFGIGDIKIYTKEIDNFRLENHQLFYDINEIKNNNQIDITFFRVKIRLFDLISNKVNQISMSFCEIERLNIENSEINSIFLEKNIFSTFIFRSNHTVNRCIISNNTFLDSNFSGSNFGGITFFRSNDFKENVFFKSLENHEITRIEFEGCNFYKNVHFDNSKLQHLHIETTKFYEFVSFQDVKLDSIFIDKTIFEKLAFFDDIEIRRFNKCNKRTLRNIKQQLLRADNKIDYNTFRIHELNSYKEELKSKIISGNRNKFQNFSDLIILMTNTFFSENGTNWLKAIKRTLFVAIFFYTIFYIMHNSNRELELLSINSYNEYIIGLFRYFLLTDFHNPLVNNKEYLSNALEWIPFIFGKIFIAIGIYEILISFRKFRK